MINGTPTDYQKLMVQANKLGLYVAKNKLGAISRFRFFHGSEPRDYYAEDKSIGEVLSVVDAQLWLRGYGAAVNVIRTEGQAAFRQIA